MKLKRTEAENEIEICASAHYVAVPVTIRRSMVDEVNGRRIVERGRLYPENDGTAMGVMLCGADVTDSDAEGSMLVHGVVFASRLPEMPSAEAIKALPLILFTDENRLPISVN